MIWIFTLFHYSLAHLQPLIEENTICHLGGQRKWYCSSAENCSKAKWVISPNCSSGLVCCDTNSVKSTIPLGRKANAYCESHLNLCRELYVGESDPNFEGGSYSKERIVEPKEHPYMALIGIERRDQKIWNCGGILITEQFILTITKCANQQGDLWVRFGSPVMVGEVQVAQVIFRTDEYPSDLALLRLKTPIVFGDSIRPICLTTMPLVPYDNIFALGWTKPFKGRGATNHERSGSVLVEALLQTKNLTYCQNGIKQDLSINQTSPNQSDISLRDSGEPLLCAGDGGKHICKGLPGIPIVVRKGNRCLRSLLGFLFEGDEEMKCSLPKRPALFKRLYHILYWIEQTIWP